jgi:microcystin-dependent protein
MASTYSTSLKLELIGNGDQSGTWGTTTNNNLGTLLEQAITGVQNITMVNTDYTLTNFNGAADEARNAVLVIGGTNSAVRNIICPSVEKTYIVNNSTSGGFAVNIKTSGGTGIQIPNGSIYHVYCDGTEFYAISKAFSSSNVANTLVLRDGSGNFAAGSITTENVSSSGTVAITGGLTLDGAAGTAGQVLVSAGSGNTPTWGNAFVAGMIMLWSGSLGSIPSGWLLCDGSNSTPDLRNRFVVGAGSTYAVGATGGSADAIVVSHTHSITDPGHNHTVVINSESTDDIDYTNTGVPYLSNRSTINTGTSTTGITIASAGSSGTNANLPPYYALCYIMKS